MAIEVDGELIEIVDAHVHMGGRPRREKFDTEKNSVAGRAYYYSYPAADVVKAMDQSNVDTIIGFALGGFSSEYDYSDQNELIAASMRRRNNDPRPNCHSGLKRAIRYRARTYL